MKNSILSSYIYLSSLDWKKKEKKKRYHYHQYVKNRPLVFNFIFKIIINDELNSQIEKSNPTTPHPTPKKKNKSNFQFLFLFRFQNFHFSLSVFAILKKKI